jgi:hypothetical protein
MYLLLLSLFMVLLSEALLFLKLWHSWCPVELPVGFALKQNMFN